MCAVVWVWVWVFVCEGGRGVIGAMLSMCTGITLQKEAKDAVLRVLGGVENLLLAVTNKGCSG